MNRADRIAALEVEAARIQARLDHLELVLTGDPAAWLGIMMRMPETVAEVTINAPLAEARQQAVALATIVRTLATLAAGEEPAAVVRDVADEVAARRRDKLSQVREQQGS